MSLRCMRACAMLATSLLTSCSALVGLPRVATEESPLACANGTDDDLDGEVDCADPSCAARCWDGLSLGEPSTAGCFADEARGLMYQLHAEEDGEHVRCEPDDLIVPCEPGTRFVPGAPACAAPGVACSEHVWPAESVPAQHVFPGARAGDGTLERPWATVAEALEAVPEGGTILLSAGTHASPGVVSSSVVIRGVCPTRTTILGVLRVEAGDVAIEDLTVQGGADPAELALEVLGGGRVSARGIVVDGAVEATGASAAVTLEDAWVRTSSSVGVWAQEGARVALVETVVAATNDGVRVSSGELEILAARIAGTSGVGLALEREGRATSVRGLVVEPLAGNGIELGCEGGAERCAVLEDVKVHYAIPTASAGDGIVVRAGDVHLWRTYVIRTQRAGLRIGAATVRLEDSWVEGSVEAAGILVEAGGFLVAIRTYVWDHGRVGIVVERDGLLTGSSLEVAGAPPGSIASECILARTGSTLLLEDFRLRTCEVCGLDLEPDLAGLSLGRGVIEGNTRGVCLQGSASYDIGELTTQVTYRGNSSNLLRTR